MAIGFEARLKMMEQHGVAMVFHRKIFVGKFVDSSTSLGFKQINPKYKAPQNTSAWKFSTPT